MIYVCRLVVNTAGRYQAAVKCAMIGGAAEMWPGKLPPRPADSALPATSRLHPNAYILLFPVKTSLS